MDGSTVVVVPPVSGDTGASPDPTAGVAAVAALEQAGENAVTLEALRTLVERITARFALEITAITERVDALSAILISAMEELDLEEEIPEEEEIEEEVPLEEEVVELSDTAEAPDEEAPEASERHSDVAGGTDAEQRDEGPGSGTDTAERSEHRTAPKSRKLSGPFARH